MHRPRARIFSSFSFLNITQFMGALNDNVFKIVIVFLLIGVLGAQESSTILAISGAVYVLPFLLFSIPAGTLADRFSKRNITVWTKVMEVVVMSLGVLAFAVKSVWGSYTILFLMATQSAFFGPSKYGIVPELVRRDQISHANGILTALTVLATILGTFLASLLSQITARNYVMVALFCVLISFIGLIASFCIAKTPAMGVKRKFTGRFVTGVVRVLIRAKGENYLMAAIIGSATFFMFGAFAQLNVITFGMQSLGLTDIGGGYLFLITALGIALGATLAGMLCGKQVELGICPLAGWGVALFFFLIALFQHNLVLVCIFLFLLGTFGGIFLVPFDAYIQAASPDRERGENVAAGNFLAFFGVLLASGLIAFFGDLLGITAAEGFAWVGVIGVFVAAWFTYRLSDAFVRLASRMNFHRGKHIQMEGRELVHSRSPTLYICLVKNWEVGLLVMITLQQRYMRFLIERPKTRLTFHQRWLLRLAKVGLYDSDAPEEGSAAFAKGKKWLQRGYSLTIIPADVLTKERREHLDRIGDKMVGDLKCTRLESTITTHLPKPRAHLTPDVSVTITD